jgi:hypothetical protein
MALQSYDIFSLKYAISGNVQKIRKTFLLIIQKDEINTIKSSILAA